MLAKALLSSARDAEDQAPLLQHARTELERCRALREPYHLTPALRDQDVVYHQATDLVRALDEGTVAEGSLTRPIWASRTLGVDRYVDAAIHRAVSRTMRRYCFSINFPEHQRAFAEDLALALAAAVGDENVLRASLPSVAGDHPAGVLLNDKASGYGEPSAQLKQEMKARYNIKYKDES